MKTQKRFAICGRFKRHTVLGLCLTLALFMAGFSGAQAAILIDDFEDSRQVVPEVDPPSKTTGPFFLRVGQNPSTKTAATPQKNSPVFFRGGCFFFLNDPHCTCHPQ